MNSFIVYFVDASTVLNTDQVVKSIHNTLAESQNSIDQLSIKIIEENNGTKHVNSAIKVVKDDKSRKDGYFLKRSISGFPNRVEVWKKNTVYEEGYIFTNKTTKLIQKGYFDILKPSVSLQDTETNTKKNTIQDTKENTVQYTTRKVPKIGGSVISELNNLVNTGRSKINLKPIDDRNFIPEVEKQPRIGFKDSLHNELFTKITKISEREVIKEKESKESDYIKVNWTDILDNHKMKKKSEILPICVGKKPIDLFKMFGYDKHELCWAMKTSGVPDNLNINDPKCTPLIMTYLINEGFVYKIKLS